MRLYFQIGPFEVALSAERRAKGYVFTPNGSIPPGAVGQTFVYAQSNHQGHLGIREVPAGVVKVRRDPNRKIKDLRPGQKGFTQPWAVKDGVLDTDFLVYPEYGGAVNMPVWRLKSGGFAWSGLQPGYMGRIGAGRSK